MGNFFMIATVLKMVTNFNFFIQQSMPPETLVCDTTPSTWSAVLSSYIICKWICKCEVAVVQYVVCRLIRRKSLGSYPRSIMKKMKYENYFFGTFLSQQISGKNFEKKFLKSLSFEVSVKLQVPLLAYKINAHNMSGVRSQPVILTERL